MNYNDLTRRHFERAAAAGVLSGPRVRRGEAGDRAQGTWVQFTLRMPPEEAAASIEAVRFLAFGCPHVIAVADWVCEAAVGRPPGRALPETVQRLRERFAVPIDKTGRLLIVEDAWIAAVSSPYGL